MFFFVQAGNVPDATFSIFRLTEAIRQILPSLKCSIIIVYIFEYIYSPNLQESPLNIGAAKGDIGNVPPPPEMEKCCRKMMLFPKALFLATTFQKLLKLNFSIEFSAKNLKISQNFLDNLYFSSKGAKTQ